MLQLNVRRIQYFIGKTSDSTRQNYALAYDSYGDVQGQGTLNIKGNNASIRIRKIDSETKEVLSGVLFQIQETNGTIIDMGTTNAQGIIEFKNLYPRTIIIVEAATREEYIINIQTENATLVWGETVDLTIENEHKKGSIRVVKTDKDNNSIKLSGIVFELYDSSNKKIGTYTTDSNGEITINNLRIGDYKLREITGKAGYYDLTSDIPVTVEYNKTNTVTIENEKEKGQIRIIKIDEEFNEIKLKGVVFELLDKNKNVIETITTNENGEALTSKWPSYNETYYIREKSTLDTYILNTEIMPVTIVKDKINDVVITNEHKKGNLRLYKVDKDNNKITIGAIKFELYDSNNKKIGIYATDENGEIYIEDLRVGEYVIKEVTQKNGYELAADTTVEIRWKETTNTIVENEQQKGQIRVIKVDAEDNIIKLAGVKFEILDEDMKLVEELITDENGEAISSKLKSYNHTYYIREKETLEDYVLNDEIIEIQLEANQVKEMVFENQVKRGKIGILKVDKDSNAKLIEGVTFEIIDNLTNEVVDTITTNELGIAVSKDLKANRIYTVRETETNYKYNINTEEFLVEVKASEVVPLKIENEAKKGQVRVVKVDQDDSNIKLEGVKFEILDRNMNIIEELITDENGEAISSELPCIDETYYLREKESLDNYILNTEIKEFTLEENQINTIIFGNEKKEQKTMEIEVENNPIKIDIDMSKESIMEIIPNQKLPRTGR